MQIAGFGAQELSATPQIFQALSIGGSPPVPPAPNFGTPNAHAVPVQQASAAGLPLNLTLQAQPTADAIDQIARSASLAGLSSAAPTAVPAVSNPPVPNPPPNTTAFVGATDPNEQIVQGNPTPPNAPPPAPDSQPAVNFTVVAPPPDQTTTQTLAQDAIAPPPQTGPPAPPPPYTLSNSGDGHDASAKSATPVSTPSAVTTTQPATSATTAESSTQTLAPPANPSLVQQVTSTVQSLLIGKIYPAPVFSFLV